MYNMEMLLQNENKALKEKILKLSGVISNLSRDNLKLMEIADVVNDRSVFELSSDFKIAIIKKILKGE